MKILVLHGPNLNLLGTREPDKYGQTTLESINNELKTIGSDLGVDIECFQSNTEGELITKIQQAKNVFEGIVINPAAYTHTSIGLRDALQAVNIPAVEVHLSNIYSREEFRQHSYLAPVCIGQISGFKSFSYVLGLKAIVKHLQDNGLK
jgi:3-dehydroquinate dehydratase-2